MNARSYHLDHELHVHLYGCLTPQDVWDIGREVWRERTSELQWYESEFQKAYGRLPAWRQYWTSDHGVELIANDFLCRTATPFPQFQASFNLLIALMPLASMMTEVIADHVLAGQRRQGILHAEYRTILPHTFSDVQLDQYLTGLAAACQRLKDNTSGTYSAAMVLNITRDDAHALGIYRRLRSWLSSHPREREFLTAIDFSGDEEPYPPKHKRDLIRQIRSENRTDPSTALAVTYHVGEQFVRLHPLSAVRWVWEAATMGVHRLGHALALGIEPKALIGRQVSETNSEWNDQIQWMQQVLPALDSESWKSDLDYWSHRHGSPGADRLESTFTEEDACLMQRIQNAVMKDLSQRQMVIESCPRSNLVIGGLSSPSEHPLKRFLGHGLIPVLSTDDPGIFGTNLKEEETLVRSMGIEHADIIRMAKRARECTARLLSHRIF